MTRDTRGGPYLLCTVCHTYKPASAIVYRQAYGVAGFMCRELCRELPKPPSVWRRLRDRIRYHGASFTHNDYMGRSEYA